MLLLRKYDLAGKYHSSPHKQLPKLWSIFEKDPTAETCFALSELSYIAGKRKETRDPERAQGMFWHSSLLSYTYLFDPTFNRGRNPYDPQFRAACDLYNSSLDGLLRIARDHKLLRPRGKIPVPNGAGMTQLPMVNMDFEWRNELLNRFEFVSDYELKGLKNQYKTHGLGVPLIAVRGSRQHFTTAKDKSGSGPSFAVTAFLRFDQFARNLKDAAGGQIELYDPLNSTEIQVANRTVSLESDISTPLAYFLDDSQWSKVDNLGLFQLEKTQQLAGIYMVQPYQPDKIPVLMIHGLWSSPMTWMEAFNDLRSEKGIREKYQFWFYLYPTGKSFWESSADLRSHLAEIDKAYSRPDEDNQLDNIVLVGHSMGGLIAKLQTLDSGNQIWGTLSKVPFEDVKADATTRNQIKRTYFFEKNPKLKRVVTIGTPHRGSSYSNSFTQNLLRPFIVFPEKTAKSGLRLLLNNPDLLRDSSPLLVSTGVDSLDPDSEILQVLAEARLPQEVHYHNVVGVKQNDVPLEKSSDGVVAYNSSHFDNAESEIVVRAAHSEVQRHPRTILEIRRILMDHLAEVSNQNPSGVIQLGDERLKADSQPFGANRPVGQTQSPQNAAEWFSMASHLPVDNASEQGGDWTPSWDENSN